MTNFYTIEVKDNKINVLEQNAEYTTDYVEELLNRINTLELIAKNQSASITEKDNKIKDLERQNFRQVNELLIVADEVREYLNKINDLENEVAELEEENYNKNSELQDALDAIYKIVKPLV